MSAANPTVVITIAVDTQYVYSQQPGPVSGGIYMMDNWVNSGSSGEGSNELNTQNVETAEWVGWNAIAVDTLGQQGDSVRICGFEVSNGTNVWGDQGYWQTGSGTCQWIAQAQAVGSLTYQVKLGVTLGDGQPERYYMFDPFLSVIA